MKTLTSRTMKVLPIVLLSSLYSSAVLSSARIDDELADFSLEQLLDIEITSVSKKKQRLEATPSAIFVITQRDIKNSGVTNIPDALRLAPGINVNRIDSSKWAVGSRGFNGRFSNKLLVLMDGRTIYSPAYSGVYWEVQDLLLSNVERIEVIRGPGATVIVGDSVVRRTACCHYRPVMAHTQQQC